jgi:hypothetical protein
VALAAVVLAVLALDHGWSRLGDDLDRRGAVAMDGSPIAAAALATSARRSTAGSGSPSWRRRTGRPRLIP